MMLPTKLWQIFKKLFDLFFLLCTYWKNSFKNPLAPEVFPILYSNEETETDRETDQNKETDRERRKKSGWLCYHSL